MARSLRFWLAAPEASQLDPGDVPLALGVLLVRASRQSRSAPLRDRRTVDKVLARQHDLTPGEATEMREICEMLELFAPDTARLAALLQRAAPHAERRALAIALRDAAGHGDPAELLSVAEDLFGIAARDLARPPRVA